MMASDIWPRLWLLAMAYPLQALLLLFLVWALGTLVAVAVVSLSRPELPLHRWEDDDDQHRAVSRRMPLS